MKSMTVDLRDVVYALSDALDLVGITDVGHGKRVGIMAAACARTLGLRGSEVAFLFDLGLLHDIGVSSSRTHSHLVEEFDWENSQEHCEIGYARLHDFLPLARMAMPIRYHHTRWDQLGESGELSASEASQANLIFLVDRVDALAAPYYADRSILMHTAAIREQIRRSSGRYFAPELVDVFLKTSSSEAFWLQLDPRGIQAVLNDQLSWHEPYQVTLSELKQLGEIFSRIVDAKSPFTAEHSTGVSRLARFIAERMGVSRENCDKIEIAGLLHDLGKLRVPDEILEKPGALDEQERKIINSHSFETYQILRNIKGFEDITPWAAYHHEEPDGSGYPFRVRNIDLPLEARILRVADIFQAMVQHRPYRRGMSASEVLDFMQCLAVQGRVEGAIVDVCAANIQAAMTAALPNSRLH